MQYITSQTTKASQHIESRIMSAFTLIMIGLTCTLVPSVHSCSYSASPEGLRTLVLGARSGPGDDAPSTATCPSGSITVDCYCTVSNICDGVLIVGQDCIAYNRVHNPAGVQAAAVCLADDSDSQYEVVTTLLEKNPIATCPDHYEVVSCSIENPWSPHACVKPEISEDGTQCQTAVECDVGCFVVAVCKSEDEYEDEEY